MNAIPFTCDNFDALLPDLLEDALDVADRNAADAHAAQCARCRGLLSDLTTLRTEASGLPLLVPSRDLWDGISERIQTPTIALRPGVRAGWWQSPSRLAAAAVVLMAVTAGTTWTFARRMDVPATEATISEMVEASASSRVAAAYDGQIAQLSSALAKRQPALDSTTSKVLAENMAVIDDAIARVRSALDAAPASALLSQQLARAYDMKLGLLRQVASTPIE